MINQSFINFFYSHSMFYGQFDQNAWIYDVLFVLYPVDATATGKTNNATITAIVNDTRYGMGTVRNLTIWIAAVSGDAEATTLLKNHYFSGSVKISDEWFTTLTSSTSWIAKAIGTINKAVVSESIVDDVTKITPKFMGAQQWAMSNLLNNTAYAINETSYVPLKSAYEVGMNFLLQPEITSAGCDVSFTAEEAMAMFEQDISAGGVVTFLSPINYFTFQEYYETNNWPSILGTFGLS